MRQIGDASPEDVRAIRVRRGWTQSQLARALGTDSVTVSRWERGISRPRPGARMRLHAMGIREGPSSAPRFAEDPAVRIRRLDRVRLEQLELKNRVRFTG